MKTSELTGVALDWVVSTLTNPEWDYEDRAYNTFDWIDTGDTNDEQYSPSTDWSQGGPILHENSISVIRCDDDYKTDRRGFTTSKRIPVWGAVIGEQHNIVKSRDSYGSPCEDVYEVNADIVSYGPTPLIAAMRCYVASKLGETAEVPAGAG